MFLVLMTSTICVLIGRAPSLDNTIIIKYKAIESPDPTFFVTRHVANSQYQSISLCSCRQVSRSLLEGHRGLDRGSGEIVEKGC